MALRDNLIEQARKIIDEVESLTGKPVEILEYLKLETPAATDPGFGKTDKRCRCQDKNVPIMVM